MGMPCEVNNILKLSSSQGYPDELVPKAQHQVSKGGYRIIPIDVPISLVDENWNAQADVIIRKLTWEKGETIINFEIARVYKLPICVKETESICV
jgi:hypothetical protein